MNKKITLLAAAITASLMLTGCGAMHGKQESGNYQGELKIGKPYNIDGRTYYPEHDPNYTEEGMASWYGPGFHGRSTANGERFDQHEMTAAHRTLPMPSLVKVTNMENGKSAIVKVNDRGPFKKDRIIDLSKSAADAIGMTATGTAKVRVEYLPTETKKLVSELVRTNQLHADEQTLAMLAIDAPTSAPAPAPASSGLFSAFAAEPEIPVSPASKMSNNRAIAPTANVEPVHQQALMQEGSGPSLDSPPPVVFNNEPSPAQGPPIAAPTESPPVQQPLPIAEEQPQMIAAPSPEPPPALPDDSGAGGFYVQAGSFSQSRNAESLAQKLSAVGAANVKPVEVNGRTWYRVRVGPWNATSDAGNALQNVMNMGLPDARIVHE